MALVRVKMVGKGTPDDPHRAPLPTYREVITLKSQGVVYALIPDEDFPGSLSSPDHTYEETGHGPALVRMDAGGHSQWHRHLDDRYQERAGDFRPEIA
jgi:hypothetical protein